MFTVRGCANINEVAMRLAPQHKKVSLKNEHVQDFEKAAIDADYDGYPLIVEFKCSLNPALRKRITELRPMPVTIMDWYREALMTSHELTEGVVLWKEYREETMM